MFWQLCHGFGLSKIMNSLLVFPFCYLFVTVLLQWINAGFDTGETSKEVSYPIAFTQILGSGMASTSKASLSAAQPGIKSVGLSMDKSNTGTVGIKMIVLGK
nr:MAG TPA: hypothetical protein [Caudoviricetes sp.]